MSAKPKKTSSKVAYSLIHFCERQKLSSDRLRRLRKASEAYAAEHGMLLDKLVSTSIDTGATAYKGKNRAGDPIHAFKRAIDQGLIAPGSTLLVESLESVTFQHPRDLYSAMEEIMKHDITIITLSDQAKYNSATIAANPIDLIVSIVRLCLAQEATEVRRQIALQSKKSGS